MSGDVPESERVADNHVHTNTGDVTIRHTHRVAEAEYHPVAYRLAHPGSDTEPDPDDPAAGWDLPPR